MFHKLLAVQGISANPIRKRKPILGTRTILKPLEARKDPGVGHNLIPRKE